MQELTEYIYSKEPGDTVNLKVLRGTEELEIKIILGEK